MRFIKFIFVFHTVFSFAYWRFVIRFVFTAYRVCDVHGRTAALLETFYRHNTQPKKFSTQNRFVGIWDKPTTRQTHYLLRYFGFRLSVHFLRFRSFGCHGREYKQLTVNKFCTVSWSIVEIN